MIDPLKPCASSSSAVGLRLERQDAEAEVLIHSHFADALSDTAVRTGFLCTNVCMVSGIVANHAFIDLYYYYS